MGACAERDINLAFLRPSGRFLARVTGRTKGNLLLRKKQYELTQDEAACLSISASCLLGKVANSRTVIERGLRDHTLLLDVQALQAVSDFLKATLSAIREATSIESLRGLEGSAAKQYYRVFGAVDPSPKRGFSLY
jgi:CRISPR-associated protein Cas1